MAQRMRRFACVVLALVVAVHGVPTTALASPLQCGHCTDHCAKGHCPRGAKQAPGTSKDHVHGHGNRHAERVFRAEETRDGKHSDHPSSDRCQLHAKGCSGRGIASLGSVDPLVQLGDFGAELPCGSAPLPPMVSIPPDLFLTAPPDPPPVSTDLF